MPDRRQFLALGAALIAPRLAWAGAGAPAHWLAAAQRPSGDYELVGVGAGGEAVFRLPLPGRGHAAARHPSRPEAVAFARRPGSFALVIDCAEGRETRRLESPEGRHFYGHGAFTADGAYLFTTENAWETGEGRLGIWDTASWTRIGEIPSGGIGPHEVLLMPDDARLAVANGGIRTHPDSERAKLNLPDMDPSIALLDTASGAILEQHRPPPELRMNSTRHLAVRADGTLAVAMQWEGGELAAPPLLALLRPGGAGLELLSAEERIQRRSRNYGGSAAFSGDGASVAVTCPRGNLMLVFETETGTPLPPVRQADICGAAPAPGGFLCSTGEGRLLRVADDGTATPLATGPSAFDNHLVAI